MTTYGHQTTDHGPRTTDRQPVPAFILRAGIQNDLALIEHYNGLLQGEVEMSIAQRVELLARRATVATRMHARCDQLSAALPPACTSRATSQHGDNSGTPEPITTAAC